MALSLYGEGGSDDPAAIAASRQAGMARSADSLAIARAQQGQLGKFDNPLEALGYATGIGVDRNEIDRRDFDRRTAYERDLATLQRAPGAGGGPLPASPAGAAVGTGGGPTLIDTAAQDELRKKQMALIMALEDQANGVGPSLAQAQLRQATDRNLGQTMALAATVGQGGPRGAVLRGLGNRLTGANQQAAQDSSMLRLQEQLQARNQLGAIVGGARGQDIGLATGQAEITSREKLAQLQQALQQQQLMIERERLKIGQEQADRGFWSNLLGGVLSTAGTIGGAVLGGPIGAGIGAKLGQSVGGWIGEQQTANASPHWTFSSAPTPLS